VIRRRSWYTLNAQPRRRIVSFVPNLAQSCRENNELLEDLARYAEGVYDEKFIRRKYRDLLDNEAWELLASDDLLVQMVAEAQARRLRSGAAKKELAQKHIVRGVGVLTSIMDDVRTSPKSKIDSVRALDALADPGSPQFARDEDRIVIKIDLSGDAKLKDPKDVLIIDAATRPNPNPIDATPASQELPPPKRGRGRPPGSKNKPKTEEAEMLPRRRRK
jgi:hypothetical protein